MRYFILLAGMVLVLATAASGETYVVNPEGTGDFPTIQAAIDSVLDGDIIELTDGTFTGDGNRDVDYCGKVITVRSQSGNPESCIIDCEGSAADPHRGFHFHSAETWYSLLQGVTIRNGFAEGYTHGGAIHCTQSGPRIVGCVFEANEAFFGGALFGSFSSAVVGQCVFRENSAVEGGGAWFGQVSHPTFTECTFVDNTAAEYGGALAFWFFLDPEVINCTLVGNAAGFSAGGILCGATSAPTLENTVIAFGSAGGSVDCIDHESVNLICCDLYGNIGGDWIGCMEEFYGTAGNISADPLFCDPGNGDFTLQDCSPCGPFSPPNPECDLIGAWPIGCSGTPVTETTWGGIKALFRQ